MKNNRWSFGGFGSHWSIPGLLFYVQLQLSYTSHKLTMPFDIPTKSKTADRTDCTLADCTSPTEFGFPMRQCVERLDPGPSGQQERMSRNSYSSSLYFRPSEFVSRVSQFHWFHSQTHLVSSLVAKSNNQLQSVAGLDQLIQPSETRKLQQLGTSHTIAIWTIAKYATLEMQTTHFLDW